jgi:hypothetical protein
LFSLRLSLFDLGESVTVAGLDKSIEDQIAMEAKLERIKMPSIKSKTYQIRRALKRYFSSPKLLQQGSVFSIVVHCAIGSSSVSIDDSDDEEPFFDANPSTETFPLCFLNSSTIFNSEKNRRKRGSFTLSSEVIVAVDFKQTENYFRFDIVAIWNTNATISSAEPSFVIAIVLLCGSK